VNVIVSKITQETRTAAVGIAEDMSVEETINQMEIGHDVVEIMFRKINNVCIFCATD
jgi:type III secretion system FlhB-like substrate exporter